MKLTEKQVLRYPALACLMVGHDHIAFAPEAYMAMYGEPPQGDFVLGDRVSQRACGELEKLLGDVDWMRQTVHRAHHHGKNDLCKKNTCDAALKLLGKRS